VTADTRLQPPRRKVPARRLLYSRAACFGVGDDAAATSVRARSAPNTTWSCWRIRSPPWPRPWRGGIVPPNARGRVGSDPWPRGS